MTKKFNFAITDNTDYDALQLTEFFSAALFEGPTASRIKPIPGIKSTVKLPRYDAGEMIKDAGCAWSATGEGTLAEKEFSVVAKDIQMEFCTTTFEANFLGELLAKGHNTGEVAPSLFLNYVAEQAKKHIKQALTVALWQGDTESLTYPNKICDGLVKKLTADSDVIDVEGTTVTSSNVIAEITKVYNKIPKALVLNPELKIFVSDNVFRSYVQAIATASAEAYFVGAKEGNFLGVELIRDPGMADNDMVAGVLDNFILLTDMLSDEEYLNFLPQAKTTGVRSLRVAGGFKIGYDYFVGSEIVFYTPPTGS